MKIAIDGPAGAGKSTVAKAVAEKLGINYLDTGAMYRAAAYAMLQQGIEPGDIEKVVLALDNLSMEIAYKDRTQHVLINGEDVTQRIRTPQISKGASDIAVIPEVRVKLVEIQRNVAKQYDLVMDGRDIGTYVLPDADYKIFLTASAKERALRRYREMTNAGQDADLDEIERGIIARDQTDSTRKFAPLRQADDAVLVDTTSMGKHEVICAILKLIKGDAETK
ncbi:MAG: (d)CMP kinase [Christensenella sp.]|nr:(d)CMP kinase [Christensenella sp.]